MAYSNSVIKANHFLVELLPEARNGFLLAMQKFGPNHKTCRTFTESNISGIECLSITTTYENIVLRNNFSPEYICDLNNEFELIICGKYSNYMVNLPFTIINKKEQWSLCCKINFTLHLSQLLDKGLYVVVSIPLYGIQAVINYNCFTKDVTVIYRLTVSDGTPEDRNKASSDGCKLVCLNVDIIKNKIDKRIFDANDVLMQRPVALCNDPRGSESSRYSTDIQPPPPPRRPGASLNQQPTPPNTIRSTYSNTPNTSPPNIPRRPNTTWSGSYSVQGGYSTQFIFGTQRNPSTQSNTSVNQYNAVPPRIAPKPQTSQNTPQPPKYSYSAPNTPTIQHQPQLQRPQPQTISTGTKTEPVRKGAEQFSVTINKACNGIDRFMTKASNALAPSKKSNQNYQQPQIAPVVKTY